MTLGLPHQAAPWWAIIALALLGAGVGAGVRRVLADGAYRHLDERDRPAPRHTWWLVIAVALAWASLTFRLGGYAQWSLLPAYLYLGVVGVALALIDLDVHRLPDLIVLPSYPIAIVLLLVPTVVTGQWGALLRAVLGGLALWLAYLVLALVSPGGGGLGFGDVKLAGVLGLFLGWVGWPPVMLSVFAAFLIGGVLSLILLLARRASRSSHIAFGPSMILGAWAALLFPVISLQG
ncbi:MAG: leader peptidase (prepilin peptidase) / N-methyltransferase [Actinomycetota bacterium]|jgi:leader peptidase (prepilin peptidase)/N-methyltransferase|nr:leader peptidase (prepilin peptidase) / N-methyltransferase [Actinomycetota bacterium]